MKKILAKSFAIRIKDRQNRFWAYPFVVTGEIGSFECHKQSTLRRYLSDST